MNTRLEQILSQITEPVVACSGGLDSLVLAFVSHRVSPERTLIVHAASPAVPQEASRRLEHIASQEKWDLELIRSGELEDEEYLSNPVDRCFYCKSLLYGAIKDTARHRGFTEFTILSGANLDDEKEYRPGLIAAQAFQVRHPFLEAAMTKEDIRSLAREFGLDFSEIPASPCLASRVYTGTRVTRERLRAIDQGEMFLRRESGASLVRCRVRENQMLVEVLANDRAKISASVLERLNKEVLKVNPEIESVTLDPQPYCSGRAFIKSQ